MSATNLQTKVVAYLVHGEIPNLKNIISIVKRIKFTKTYQEIIDLCIKYTKLKNKDFSLGEYIYNEYQNANFLDNLISQADITYGLFKINLDKLVVLQETQALKNEIKKLATLSPNQVLKRIKELKGIKPLKPFNLGDIRDQRLIDRDYEKIAPLTGYRGLDKIIKGFVPGHVITLTGDTNVGKSTICCNFAYNVAKQGKKVLYFSLEPDITIIEYLASIWSFKRFTEIKKDDLNPPQNIKIDVYTKQHVRSLDEMVDVVENSDRYDLIIVDHFGYFTSSGKNKTQSESNAMKAMATLAKKNKSCILLVVHPRKTAAGKKRKSLTIQDISGSAAFSQDATDVLVFIRKLDEEDQMGIRYTNQGAIIVHKTKSGPNGAVPIQFIDGSAKIIDMEEYADKEANLF